MSSLTFYKLWEPGNLMFYPWSHSKLKKYYNCQREFLFVYYLKVKPQDFGLEPYVWPTTQLGNDAHKVMEISVGKLRSGTSFRLKDIMSTVITDPKTKKIDLKRKVDLMALRPGIKKFLVDNKDLLQKNPVLTEASFVLDREGQCRPATYKNPWDMYMDTSVTFVSQPDLVINTFAVIHIYDYKTSEKIKPGYPWLDSYFAQLEEYAPIVQKALDKSKDVIIGLINLYTGEIIRREFRADILPAMLGNLEAKIPNVDGRAGDYTKPKNFPECCKFCGFKGKCDEIYKSIVE